MKKYKGCCNYLIYGHCIELECNDEKMLDKCIKELNEADYYYNKIADSLMQNELSGTFIYENESIDWKTFVYIVETEWIDEDMAAHDIDGVFNDLEKARATFRNLVEEEKERFDIIENKDIYTVEDSNDTFQIFETGDYNNNHVNITITKVEVN